MKKLTPEVKMVDILPIPNLTHKHGKHKVDSSTRKFLDLGKRFTYSRY